MNHRKRGGGGPAGAAVLGRKGLLRKEPSLGWISLNIVSIPPGWKGFGKVVENVDFWAPPQAYRSLRVGMGELMLRV